MAGINFSNKKLGILAKRTKLLEGLEEEGLIFKFHEYLPEWTHQFEFLRNVYT